MNDIIKIVILLVMCCFCILGYFDIMPKDDAILSMLLLSYNGSVKFED